MRSWRRGLGRSTPRIARVCRQCCREWMARRGRRHFGWWAISQVAARKIEGRDLRACLRALVVDEYGLFLYRNAFGALISSCRSGIGTTPAAPLNMETLLPPLLRTYI